MFKFTEGTVMLKSTEKIENGFIKVTFKFMSKEVFWYEWEKDLKISVDKISNNEYLLARTEDDNDETRYGVFKSLKECQEFLEQE